jgi:hypothetical protein
METLAIFLKDGELNNFVEGKKVEKKWTWSTAAKIGVALAVGGAAAAALYFSGDPEVSNISPEVSNISPEIPPIGGAVASEVAGIGNLSSTFVPSWSENNVSPTFANNTIPPTKTQSILNRLSDLKSIGSQINSTCVPSRSENYLRPAVSPNTSTVNHTSAANHTSTANHGTLSSTCLPSQSEISVRPASRFEYAGRPFASAINTRSLSTLSDATAVSTTSTAVAIFKASPNPIKILNTPAVSSTAVALYSPDHKNRSPTYLSLFYNADRPPAIATNTRLPSTLSDATAVSTSTAVAIFKASPNPIKNLNAPAVSSTAVALYSPDHKNRSPTYLSLFNNVNPSTAVAIIKAPTQSTLNRFSDRKSIGSQLRVLGLGGASVLINALSTRSVKPASSFAVNPASSFAVNPASSFAVKPVNSIADVAVKTTAVTALNASSIRNRSLYRMLKGSHITIKRRATHVANTTSSKSIPIPRAMANDPLHFRLIKTVPEVAVKNAAVEPALSLEPSVIKNLEVGIGLYKPDSNTRAMDKLLNRHEVEERIKHENELADDLLKKVQSLRDTIFRSSENNTPQNWDEMTSYHDSSINYRFKAMYYEDLLPEIKATDVAIVEPARAMKPSVMKYPEVGIGLYNPDSNTRAMDKLLNRHELEERIKHENELVDRLDKKFQSLRDAMNGSTENNTPQKWSEMTYYSNISINYRNKAAYYKDLLSKMTGN